ncbi:hypothetical protein CRENBAI_019146 [Crenichthys baileyi]|uniref:Uncharacterized protein n=1 Tax=Crenichthys baileyi TaxID=28760 RepID=A0AAV9SH60_9TELE
MLLIYLSIHRSSKIRLQIQQLQKANQDIPIPSHTLQFILGGSHQSRKYLLITPPSLGFSQEVMGGNLMTCYIENKLELTAVKTLVIMWKNSSPPAPILWRDSPVDTRESSPSWKQSSPRTTDRSFT